MKPENLQERIFQVVTDFLHKGPQNGVNNFVLEGPGNVPTNYNEFIALFPPITDGEVNFVILASTPQHRDDPKYFYEKVLKLEISDRIKSLRIVDHLLIRRGFEAISSLEGLPIIVLAIGKTLETNEENIALFCIKGISPETALAELQEKVQQRKTRLN